MPRQMAAAVERLLGLLERQPGGLAEALDRVGRAALFGDPVELALGPLDLGQRRHFLGGVERALHHIAPDTDEGPQQGQVIDLRGEIARADHRRARAGQLGEIGRPPTSFIASSPSKIGFSVTGLATIFLSVIRRMAS